MGSIEIFKNESFGEVRVAGTSEKPLFCLSDVCKVLELGNPSQVKTRLDNGVISNEVVPDSLGRQQEIIFVNEDGLYDVILDSRKPQAKAFRKWITSEVLPSIRKTGNYSLKQLSPMEMQVEMLKSMQFQLQSLIETKEEVKQLKSELEEIKQRTTTDLHRSTIVAYVTRNKIRLDVKRLGAIGTKASYLCKKRGIQTGKINDVRWGKVTIYPDEILDEIFAKENETATSKK